MKKEVKISRLMDAYEDSEFFIQGESEVDLDTVKNNVIAKAAVKNKRVKPLVKVLIAAAAAAVLATTAIAANAIMSGKFTMANGGESSYELYPDGQGVVTVVIGQDDFLVKKGDRLYFAIDGKKTDITDAVDTETPYIYTYETEGNSKPVHIIAGGTPEHYAYVQLAYYEGMGWNGIGCFDNTMREVLFVGTQEKPVFDGDGNILHEYMWFLYRYRNEDRNENDYYDSDEQSVLYKYSNDSETGDELPASWREDSEVAWLIAALDKLGIIEAPEQ